MSEWRRLARILAGEEPVEDGSEGHDADEPAPAESAEEARSVWSLTAPDPDAGPDWGLVSAWDRLSRRIREHSASPSSPAPDVSPDDSAAPRRRTSGRGALRRNWSGRVLKVAAGVVLAAVAVWALELAPFPGSTNPADRTFATSSGQRLELRLPEGSRVEVGPESKLTLLDGFDEGARIVRLRGLAFFHVEASESRPFVVRTRGGSARAVGTMFSVRAYDDEGRTRVVVKEGSVGLAAGSEGGAAAELVSAGEVGVFSAKGTVTVERAPVERALAWRNGTVTFDGTPLRQLTRELQRWYGIDVAVGDSSIAGRRFTGDFTHESMTQIADIVSASLGVDYRVRDSTVVFVASP